MMKHAIIRQTDKKRKEAKKMKVEVYQGNKRVLREFPALAGTDMYRFLSLFDAPVMMGASRLVFQNEEDYREWRELILAYKSLLAVVEKVRKVDPDFIALLEKEGEKILWWESNLPKWLAFASQRLKEWRAKDS